MHCTIIGHKTHPLGGFYLAHCADGAWLAGTSEASARKFGSAQVAYDTFKPLSAEGCHWAWNLCYLLEDHLTA